MTPDWLIAIYHGIVEGLTEFIPVSSTGHLILFEYVMHLPSHKLTFQISIQLGAIGAAIIYYSGFLKKIILQSDHRNRFLLNITIAMIPSVIVGLIAYEFIKEMLFNPIVVCIALGLGGIVMLCVDRWAKDITSTTTDLSGISKKQALAVGLCQIASLCPGMSRSGSAIVGGLISKLSYRIAADFSFILAIPVITGAVVFELMQSASVLSMTDFYLISVGFIAAFFTSLIAIHYGIKWIKQWHLTLLQFIVSQFL